MLINGGYAAGAADAQSQRRRLDYEALAQAVAAGDLEGAQLAYSNIISQLPAGSKPNPDSILGKIWTSLQAGDLASAKQFLNWGDKRKVTQAPAPVNVVQSLPTPANSRYSRAENSSAMALNQAIQAGDKAKAQYALKNIIADLTDAASVGGLSGARGASAYSRMSTPGSAANELLQSPHFQALEDAIAKGDPLGMRAAWAMLISGSLNFAASTRRNPSAAPPSYGFTQTRAVAAI
jgi:DNA-binding FadR family transcriptional regulator